jgi:hypothetical protein
MDGHGADPRRAGGVLGRELSAYMPIFGGPGAGSAAGRYVVRCKSACAALDAALENADVLVTWGVQNLGDLVKGHRLSVVLVSHGSGSWAIAAVQSSESGATHFVGVSEPALQPFSATVRARARVLHNGIDVERCTPTASRAETRVKWGFTDREIVIGYVGRYSAEKNPAAAAKAAAQSGGRFRAFYAGQGWMQAALRIEVAKIAGPRALFVPPDRSRTDLGRASDGISHLATGISAAHGAEQIEPGSEAVGQPSVAWAWPGDGANAAGPPHPR